MSFQQDYRFAKIAATSSGNTDIVAAVTGRRIRVVKFTLITDAAVDVKFVGGSTDLTGLLSLAADGGLRETFDPTGHFQTEPGEALKINLGGAAVVGGYLQYVFPG